MKELVHQSGFTDWISSDIWRRIHCLSRGGRRPAMPSEEKRTSRHFTSQQPKFILPLAFLPSQRRLPSMQILHHISISCSSRRSAAYFDSILQSSIPLTSHLSRGVMLDYDAGIGSRPLSPPSFISPPSAFKSGQIILDLMLDFFFFSFT